METRQEFLDSITAINPNYDIDFISRAYDVAEKMHTGQLRKSGEPYIIHPMTVQTSELLSLRRKMQASK